jgi:hypothetical protein
VRFLVLGGQAPELVPIFPPTGAGDVGPDAWGLVRQVLARHRDAALARLASPPQTNEVARCGVLLGGFVQIARRLGERLSLFEIGASGGLNLFWDQWFYRAPAWTWGDPASLLHLELEWTGPPPPAGDVQVVARRGCDVAPLDVRRADDRRRLLAYVWPDQAGRLQRLQRAIAHAAAASVRVDREEAGAWLVRHLPATAGAAVRVVYHSIVLQYLPPAGRRDLLACIRAQGAVATTAAPLAWLRMEPAADRRCAELALTTWPDGREETLATADYHGRWVHWLTA